MVECENEMARRAESARKSESRTDKRADSRRTSKKKGLGDQSTSQLERRIKYK